MKQAWLAALVAVAGCAVAPLKDAAPAAIDVADAPVIRSAPIDPDAVLTRIAFGSCFAPQLEESAIWDAVAAADPDLVLLMGDNVYQSEETGDPSLAELREAYAMLAADAPFARLRAETPVLATWDDHDYGMNDAGGDFPAKWESEALFEHVWDVPDDDPRRARDGVYGVWTFGPEGRRVQIILLDTRFFRSPYAASDEPDAPGKERYVPDPDPAKTMLGDEQWAWLETTLREPADLRVLVSSVQLLADAHGFEGWRMLPTERERLVALIADTGANDVVVLSGDRHFAGLYARDGAPYRLIEATSSSLNLPFTEDRVATHSETDAARLGPIFYPANFGMLLVDWDAGSATIEIRGADGEMALSETVALEALRGE